VVVVHEAQALTPVPALVEAPAYPAPRLVHIEHLPVVQRAGVAVLGQHKRRTHAQPDGVDGVGGGGGFGVGVGVVGSGSSNSSSSGGGSHDNRRCALGAWAVREGLVVVLGFAWRICCCGRRKERYLDSV